LMVLLRFDAPGQWAGEGAAFGGNGVLTMNKEMDKREKSARLLCLGCLKPCKMRRRSSNVLIFHLSAALASFASFYFQPAFVHPSVSPTQKMEKMKFSHFI